VASAELTFPTSVAIACGRDDDDDDDDGDHHRREVIYVSNKGTSAGVGEVLRIER
jgi:hypothetical protein